MRLYIIIIILCGLMFWSCGNDDDDDDDIPPWDHIPFYERNDWESSDVTSRSTGCGVADINNDGFPDVVVANGNDVARQRVVVYFNNGNGDISDIPGWESDDIDYHGHLACGDINNDGYIDVAVSVYIGAQGFSSPGYVKVYFNRAGTLERIPSWRSDQNYYTFSLSLGDINNDGLPDLAVATGESYTGRPEKNVIFMNRGGTLDKVPGWESDREDYSLDTAFGDFDNDNDLDLIFIQSYGPLAIYENVNGTITRSPVWSSQNTVNSSNSIALGDMNNDGYMDVAVSQNYQLGVSGRTEIYLNHQGIISTTPDWVSAEEGYGSGITLADINRDGFVDLVTGTWGENYQIGNGHIRIYLNEYGTLHGSSDWVSRTNSVIEAIVFADLNQDGLRNTSETFTGSPSRTIYYVQYVPLEHIVAITLNGTVLASTDYCYDRETGWISINREKLSVPAQVSVNYMYSDYPDMVVTNWEGITGNFIFFNTGGE